MGVTGHMSSRLAAVTVVTMTTIASRRDGDDDRIGGNSDTGEVGICGGVPD
jgi:hypothetical protein